MTYVVTSSSFPIPIGPLTILQSRDITAATAWLVIVVLLAVIAKLSGSLRRDLPHRTDQLV